jgi:polyhydroxyalkanoate synthase
MMAASALVSSSAGLPIWSGGSQTRSVTPGPAWPNLPPSLAESLARTDPVTFQQALGQAVRTAAAEYAAGIEMYRRHPYRRPEEAAVIAWQQGETVLFDHGRARTPHGTGSDIPAIFVPSLINRGWIMDLIPGAGMLSWLARQGIRPFRIEWGSPGSVERHFDAASFVTQRLEPAIEETVRRCGAPPVLIGYCMGGLLALAAAVRRPGTISGLALLATPWDFHAAGCERPTAMAALYAAARPALTVMGEMPIDLIQALFALADPAVGLRKFRRFSGMDPASVEARRFVALEDWLNDGVALPLPVADDALTGWYGANTPARGAWKVDGVVIDPRRSTAPALVVIPGSDRIVPPDSAAALLAHLPLANRLDLPLGHIGMVVGQKAEEALWRPLADWILRVGGRT